MSKTQTPDKAAVLDKIIKYLEIVVAIATIIQVIWTICDGSSETVVVIDNVSPSSATDPVSSDDDASVPSVEYYAPDSDRFEDDDDRLAYSANLLEHDQFQDAEGFLTDFLNLVESDSPIVSAIKYNRGLARLYSTNSRQAIDDFIDVTKCVDYPDAYYNIGNAYAILGEDDDALKAYTQAIALSEKPEYIRARDLILTRLK